jgi:hypothetical protein
MHRYGQANAAGVPMHAPSRKADEEAVVVGQVVHVDLWNGGVRAGRVHLLQHRRRQRLRDL